MTTGRHSGSNGRAGRGPMSPMMRLAVDLGPLIVFFAANSLADIYVATLAFMIATGVAIALSWVKAGRVSPMLWVSGAAVLLFGGLTLWLHDETFIKVKPTIIYVTFAAILGFGLATGRPTLKLVLEQAYPEMDEIGWRKLTRNWALFFAGMAVLNEAVWRSVSTDMWVQFKVWGVTALSVLFALAQAPILMRHGAVGREPKRPPEPPLPPQG
jgi:intracellular septation protein